MVRLVRTTVGSAALLAACALPARVAAQDLRVPYTTFTLPNGLKVIAHEDHFVPIVTVNTWYHVGSGDERPGRTGFAHLFERRMAGPFQAGASVQSAKTDGSLIEFLRETQRIRDEAVPQAELDKAKAYLALGLSVARINAAATADVQRVTRQYLDLDRFVIVVVGDRSQIEAGIHALNEGPIPIRDLWGEEIH